MDSSNPISVLPELPLKVTLRNRLVSEGRWAQIEPLRDQMMREARAKGLSKTQAQDWTYAELERLYPPMPPVLGVSAHDSDGDASPLARPREGLGSIPAEWLPIADNAALPAELQWVQAQRLRVAEERQNGQTVVRLERAGSPPPSWAALGWLDTALRNPAKWADLCARGLAQQELESDHAKRERRSIGDVRTLLSETVGA